jgi:hypothetical protein
MDKLLDFDERFPKTGEPTVQLVAFNDRRGGLTIEKRAFAEGSSPLYEFLKGVQPEAGCSFILVNALGAYEYYDDNRNGDGFPAQPFKVGQLASCGHAECSKGMDGWISEPETLIHHYTSFEKFGGIYKHHVNKDPSKSLGYIQKAVWNSHMRRVELLLKIVNSRDPELAKRIGDGDFPAVSMGCHVRWDVCTICGHRAPTRAQYCEHARMSLRKVLPDGRKVAVLNPSPKFFDISFVFRPADPTGWMMKKVAEHAGPFRLSSEIAEEVGAITRRTEQFRAERQKVAEELATPYGSQVKGAVQEWPRLGAAQKEVLAQLGGRRALSTLSAVGVTLSTGEFIDLFAKSAGIDAAPAVVDRLVALSPALQEVTARYPNIQEKLGHLVELRLDGVNEKALRRLGAWVEKRGGMLDYLAQTGASPGAIDLDVGPGAAYRAYEPSRSDVLTMTHPMTGEQWQTTRGAAMKAHNQEAKSELVGTAILSALYTGAINKALGDAGGMWTVPAGMGAGYITQKKLREKLRPYRNTYYMTDQGIPVSGNTEFVKVSAARPNLTDALHKAAYEIVERTGDDDYDVLLQKIAREGGHDYASWLARTSLEQKVATLVRGAETPPTTAHEAPTVDLDSLVNNITRLIWR